MDKRKVIRAYRRGFLSIEECIQILGVDSAKILGLIEESPPSDQKHKKIVRIY